MKYRYLLRFTFDPDPVAVVEDPLHGNEPPHLYLRFLRPIQGNEPVDTVNFVIKDIAIFIFRLLSSFDNCRPLSNKVGADTMLFDEMEIMIPTIEEAILLHLTCESSACCALYLCRYPGVYMQFHDWKIQS